MFQILKIEKAVCADGLELPAFRITVDTGLPLNTDINKVLQTVATDLPFAYLDPDIKTDDAITAASTFSSKADIPDSSTWDRATLKESVCRAGENLFDLAENGKFVVAGIDSVSTSSLGTWLAVVWCLSPSRAREWHF